MYCISQGDLGYAKDNKRHQNLRGLHNKCLFIVYVKSAVLPMKAQCPGCFCLVTLPPVCVSTTAAPEESMEVSHGL